MWIDNDSTWIDDDTEIGDEYEFEESITEESSRERQFQAIDYIFRMGKQYARLPILSTLHSVLINLASSGVGSEAAASVTAAMCEYAPKHGLRKAAAVFEDPTTSPETIAAMAGILKEFGYKNADRVLTDLLFEDLNSEERHSVREALMDIADEETLLLLADAYERVSSTEAASDSVITALQEICDALGHYYYFDDSGHIHVNIGPDTSL
jgi:hypothetical protein